MSNESCLKCGKLLTSKENCLQGWSHTILTKVEEDSLLDEVNSFLKKGSQ